MLKQESIDQIIQQFPSDPKNIIEPISADLFNHFAINLHDQHFPKRQQLGTKVPSL